MCVIWGQFFQKGAWRREAPHILSGRLGRAKSGLQASAPEKPGGLLQNKDLRYSAWKRTPDGGPWKGSPAPAPY